MLTAGVVTVLATEVWLIWLTSLEIFPDRAGDTDAILVVGELVLGVITEVTGIGDLFIAGVGAFPKEDVDAVLNAGLADVPNTLTVVLGAGVLITIGVGAFVLGRMGLRLLVLFKIGVSLWLEARTGDGASCQLGPTWFKLLRSSFLSLLLLLLLLFKLGPFCSFNSSNELLLVTATECQSSVFIQNNYKQYLYKLYHNIYIFVKENWNLMEY